ncbi:MAG: hypothetical protein JO362_09785 [Streptomycetaceae bacterium]|nr:hypothetical protein [Streptomycetaceae bacterium]
MSDAVQPTVAEVRAAAEAVKAAIDRHLVAIENRVGEDDPAVYAAFDALASAAEAYDELLYEAYDEVTPFEVSAGEALPAYRGPAEPGAISVLIRRDYTVSEPHRLITQAARVAEEVIGAGAEVGAAIGTLFGEYEPDEIASRHKEFGLEEGDSTLWVQAADPTEPGEWLTAPFDQADPELTLYRFDISAVYDDEEDEDDSGGRPGGEG